MEVALLANTAWLDEELSLYNDLVVGLIDEQVKVTQVLPEGEGERLAPGFGRVVPWPETSWRRLNQHRLKRMTRRFEKQPPDVVHAMDGRMWPVAVAWGRRLGVPVVLSSWSVLDLPVARRLRRRLDPASCAFAAATAPLKRMLGQQVDPAFKVELTPSGVHVPAEPARDAEDREARSVVVTGNGRLDDYVAALFAGLRGLIDRYPDTQVFVDTMGADQRALWKHAEALGLLPNLSFVPRRIGHREMLLRADLFLQPQPLGRARSLLLQAMAHGRPVLAEYDDALDFLIDGQTAAVVEAPDPEAWGGVLIEWARSGRRRAELGESARRWVAQHRVASSFVGNVHQLYRVVSGESLPFDAG